jgi:hypothetical protein
MKTSPEDVTVLLVGGGSIISPDKLDGVGEIIRPPYFSVANAVGAAMAKGLFCPINKARVAHISIILVAGEIDTIEILQGRNINDVIESIKLEAIEKAVAAGANPSKVPVLLA